MSTLNLLAEKAGSISALARELDVKPQVMNRWVKQGYVPLKRARQLAATYQVPMRELVKPAIRDLIDDPAFV